MYTSTPKKDEAVILKIYDSDPTVARGSLHTGFRLPDSHRNMQDPVRESMEVRLMVFWAPEELSKQARHKRTPSVRQLASRVRQAGASVRQVAGKSRTNVLKKAHTECQLRFICPSANSFVFRCSLFQKIDYNENR